MDETQEKGKRTLLNTRENLQNKAVAMAELAKMSETLIQKFNRTEGRINKKEIEAVEKGLTQPDLIGLFEETAAEMETHICQIGANLERLLTLID